MQETRPACTFAAKALRCLLTVVLAASLLPALPAPQAYAVDADTSVYTYTTRYTVTMNKNDASSDTESEVVAPYATVTLNGTEYTADENGNVTLPIESQSDLITVSYTSGRQAYSTRTVTADAVSGTKVIRLQKASSDQPVLNAVWYSDNDVLQSDVRLSTKAAEATAAFEVEVDWGGASAGTVALQQGSVTVALTGTNSLGNVTGDVDLSQFNFSNDVYVVATDSQGRSTMRKLQMSGEASTVEQAFDRTATGDFNFSMARGVYARIPSSVPIVGGWTVASPDTSLKVPVSIVCENGEFTVSIGYTFNETDWSSDKKKEAVEGIADACKEAGLGSSSGSTTDASKFANAVNKSNKAVSDAAGTQASTTAKWGWEATCSFVGFIRGTYTNSGFTVTDMGVAANPTLSISGYYPTPIPGVSLEASLWMEAYLRMTFFFNDEVAKEKPRFQLDGTVTAYGGVLLGVKGILAAGGGATGSLAPTIGLYTWQNSPTSGFTFKLDGSIGIYAKVSVLWFEMKKTWNLLQGTLVDTSKNNSTSTQSLQSVSGDGGDGDGDGDAGTWSDASAYEAVDLSYLSAGSSDATGSEDDISLQSTTIGGDDVAAEGSELVTNIYKGASVRYVDLGDGKRLAVWNDAASEDKASDVTTDDLTLMYKYYDGSTWSEAQKVDASCDRFDGDFDVCTASDGTAYVVWQHSTTATAGQAALTSAAVAGVDLRVAAFDPQTGTFGTAVAAGTSGQLDTLPTIASADGTTYIAWVTNDESDYFSNGGTDTICYAQVTAGSDGALTVGETQTAEREVAASDALTDLAVDVKDGALQLAYTVDTDGGDTTGADTELWYSADVTALASNAFSKVDSGSDSYIENPSGVDVSEGATGELGEDETSPTTVSAEVVALPQFFEGSLYYTKGGVVQSTGLTVADGSSAVVGTDYELMRDADGDLIMVTLASNGVSSTLAAARLTADSTGSYTWSDAVDLVVNGSEDADAAAGQAGSTGYAILDFDAFMDSDGQIQALVNNSHLTDTLEALKERVQAAADAGASEDEQQAMLDSFDPYGTSSLYSVSVTPVVKPSSGLDSVYYDATEYVSGNSMDIQLAVKNKGIQVAQAVDASSLAEASGLEDTIVATVELYDSEDNLLNTYYGLLDEDIDPGAEGTITVPITVPENSTGCHARVTVANYYNEAGEYEYAVSDEYQFELTYEDLVVDDIVSVPAEDGSTVVTADVNNFGYSDFTNVQVQLLRALRDGEDSSAADGGLDGTVVLQTATIGDVASKGQGVASFKVAADQLQADDVVYVHVSSYDGSESAVVALSGTRDNDYDATTPALATSGDGGSDGGSDGDGGSGDGSGGSVGSDESGGSDGSDAADGSGAAEGAGSSDDTGGSSGNANGGSGNANLSAASDSGNGEAGTVASSADGQTLARTGDDATAVAAICLAAFIALAAAVVARRRLRKDAR